MRGLPGNSRLLTNYGICLAALGERDRARETLDDALASNPNNNEHWPHARASTHERGRRSPGGGQGPHRRGGEGSGRAAADVTLVAVAKTHGADRVRELLDAGQRVFGENRVQEAEEKVPGAARRNIPTSSCT